ncbi:hypothetical protein JSE7799_01563 [Jannaschia seosinensis]|uniref:Uncharacterized protein n=1 Tax=Jannaschia seosinensis TaxID=313367 RepID=A0A0M7BBX5_9RHOB|nr:hypothetical protein [Jannaschia seosinensis]CUH38845.1 hypothetical protein JSE7799_01563 [Jannaschia seosinensis]
MIRVLLLLLALAACAPASGSNGFGSGLRDIAAQRVRFAAEAVCLNNPTRRAQERAAARLDFPIKDRDGRATVYANPGTLTFLRIGPAPEQSYTDDRGQRRVVQGNGCSVGSPAVGVELANRLAGEILAPRLVDGSDILEAPRGAGTNLEGGVGFFFEGLAVTLPLAQTMFTDPETGESIAFDHPVILIVHG